MAKEVGEARALRAWAKGAGYQVADRGLLPESLRTQWIQVGHPWPEGTQPPANWSVTDRKANNPRRNGHVTATSATADPRVTQAVGSFSQPGPATREELGQDPLTVDLVAGGTAEVMTQQEADWFIATRDLYLAQNKFEQVSDLQDLDRLLTLELLMHRDTKWMASGKDYIGNWVNVAEMGKSLKDRSAAITALKDGMGLSKKARDANASGVNERWADILKRAKQWNVHRVEQVRVALLLMNQLSAIVGTYDRSDEEERRREGFRTETEILDWVRTEMLPKFREVDEHFRTNVQSTWSRG